MPVTVTREQIMDGPSREVWARGAVVSTLEDGRTLHEVPDALVQVARTRAELDFLLARLLGLYPYTGNEVARHQRYVYDPARWVAEAR